ncbi:MAG TPA: alanine racemase [Polyangiaceae bacterium]|nr:alanine racemase [Polyangiaceae bacterium]
MSEPSNHGDAPPRDDDAAGEKATDEKATGEKATDEHDADHGAERILRPRRALPTDVVRPTRAEVNLDNLRHNLHVLRTVSSRRNQAAPRIWAVLKADGYGHGAKAVARTLERGGVDGVCVALVEEGVELREAGISVPILVMGGYYKSAFRELLHHGLTPVLHEPAQVEELARTLASAELGRARAHIKVDTGMARLGAPPSEWSRLATVLARHREIVFEGLMTHFANADGPESDALEAPLDSFARACEVFRAEGLVPELRHAANSAALLRGGASFDVVRPGIALFGPNPLPRAGLADADDLASTLRPVMSIHTRVVAVRDLAPGDAVGYGSTWVATRPSRVATVPMGYADGLSRAVSNRGAMLVRGRRAPIVGIVSMDMTMLDVTDVPGAALGDEVVVLGSQKVPGERSSAEITAHDLARAAGTIPWEVLTNVSRRVPRFYREP